MGVIVNELKRVYWSKYWSHQHEEPPTRQHLAFESVTRKTLCGRTYPADKGRAQGFKFCKACIKKAYELGYEKGFTKDLDFIPTGES